MSARCRSPASKHQDMKAWIRAQFGLEDVTYRTREAQNVIARDKALGAQMLGRSGIVNGMRAALPEHSIIVIFLDNFFTGVLCWALRLKWQRHALP